MTAIVGKSRNPVIREAFALKAASERRMDRIAKTYRAKPSAPEPNNAKPPGSAKKGKR